MAAPAALFTDPPASAGRTVTTPLTAQADQAKANATGPTGGPVPEVIAVDPKLAKQNTKDSFVELPLQASQMWDAMTFVQEALSAHEGGLFRTSSLLVDAFGRDDRISGVQATRVNTVFSLPLSHEPPPSGKSKQAQRIADDLKPLWPRMFPQEELRKLLKWGVQMGVGLGQLTWDGWVPTLRAWHPQNLYWDWATYSFYVNTVGGVRRVTPGDGKWVLYTPYGFKYGWMEGLVRALAAPWFFRKFNYRDWARYNEVHGLPIRKAIVPADADDRHTARFAQEMAALGTESVIRVPQNGKDQPGYDLQLLEAIANTYEGFAKFMTQLDDSIAITVLGQNLTTSVKSGSLAAGRVHDGVRADLRGADATSMSGCLRSQALIHWVAFNYSMDAAEEICPVPTWQTDPPEDKGTQAASLLALAQALTAFRQAGAMLDWRKLFLDFGLPVQGSGIDPSVPIPGTQQPKDDDSDDDGPPKPGAKKKPKDMDAAIKNALEFLRESAKPGWRRGQEYADDVAALATREGARVIGRDVATILRLVRQASSPDELKKALLATFREMDGAALKKLHQKAHILARLDGRAAVVEEL